MELRLKIKMEPTTPMCKYFRLYKAFAYPNNITLVLINFHKRRI